MDTKQSTDAPIDPIRGQYERFPYPLPASDLAAYASAGGRDFSDPGALLRKLWPSNPPASPRILVAGCGTHQAALLAFSNPSLEVVGIDITSAAIQNHEQLKRRHHLDNLTLVQMPIESVTELNVTFDLIICTGVLHHLVAPGEGLRALAAVLAPRGVISGMVYGQNARHGVYLVQEALKTLQVTTATADVALAQHVVAKLPSWHAVQGYVTRAPDLSYTAGFIDTFLNARDQAYTVPGVLRLIDEAGLQLQSWLDGMHYSATANWPVDDPIQDRFDELSARDHWHVVDLLTCRVGAHRFLACHAARTPDWIPDFSQWGAEASWLQYVPARRPDVTLAGSEQLLTVTREGMSFNFAGASAHILRDADGRRTFAELLGASECTEAEAAIMSLAVEWDLITVAMD